MTDECCLPLPGSEIDRNDLYILTTLRRPSLRLAPAPTARAMTTWARERRDCSGVKPLLRKSTFCSRSTGSDCYEREGLLPSYHVIFVPDKALRSSGRPDNPARGIPTIGKALGAGWILVLNVVADVSVDVAVRPVLTRSAVEPIFVFVLSEEAVLAVPPSRQVPAITGIDVIPSRTSEQHIRAFAAMTVI